MSISTHGVDPRPLQSPSRRVRPRHVRGCFALSGGKSSPITQLRSAYSVASSASTTAPPRRERVSRTVRPGRLPRSSPVISAPPPRLSSQSSPGERSSSTASRSSLFGPGRRVPPRRALELRRGDGARPREDVYPFEDARVAPTGRRQWSSHGDAQGIKGRTGFARRGREPRACAPASQTPRVR